MNLLFFLTPKQDVLYIYEDFTLRQTLEKWRRTVLLRELYDKYTTLPTDKRFKGSHPPM